MTRLQLTPLPGEVTLSRGRAPSEAQPRHGAGGPCQASSRPRAFTAGRLTSGTRGNPGAPGGQSPLGWVAALGTAPIKVQLVSLDGLNRLTLDLLRELAELPFLHPEAPGFVVAGNDRCFSAGADLAAMAALSPADAWRLAREGQRHLSRIAAASIPYVAAVAGHCLGGGFDLALACTARVCTPDAYFGHHGARLGLITGWRGTQTLPRLLGSARALEHLLAAQGWTAPLALQQGVVDVIAPSADLLSAALQTLARLH